MIVSDLSRSSASACGVALGQAVAMPLISVVVPVRNEARFIVRTLSNLVAQRYDPQQFEILVVDGHSTDGTADLAMDFARRHAGVRVLSNPRRLSSAARNIGVRSARGDIIVVVDGHCELDDRYLSRLAAAFRRSGADCIGRPQPLNVSDGTPLQRAIAAARSSPLGHHPASHIYSSQEGFVPAKSVAVAYRRKVFDVVGLFDEEFDACEDVEFNHRVDRAAFRCYFAPQLAVRYCPRDTLGGLFYQLLRYGRGRMRLLRKHPDTGSPGTIVPLVFVIGLIAGLPLALTVEWLKAAYLAAIAAYAATLLLGSLAVAVRRRSLGLVPRLAAVLATIHLGSGIGMLLELMSGRSRSRQTSGFRKSQPEFWRIRLQMSRRSGRAITGNRNVACEQRRGIRTSPSSLSGGASRPLHVVIVDEELPYPADSGKRIRTLNLTVRLAQRHRITYVAHPGADAAETARAAQFLRSHGIETVLARRGLPGKSGATFYGRLLGNLLSPLPYSVQIHRTAALRAAIREVAAGHAVDLWHCEWTPYAESLRGAVEAPWVVMAHNVESLIWRRYAEIETNPWKRWYIRRQWRKFERFERRVFAETAQLIAVSDEDADLARNHFHAPRVEVVENGVDVAWFRPHVGHVSNVPGTLETCPTNCRCGPRDCRSLLFLGSLDWRPNLDAVRLLLDDIFPRVLVAEPQARLLIVGRKPPPWLVDRARACRNVALHADVPDVRPFLHRCGAMAVPLRVGGGSRLKILEALAAECPVVSTKVGAEGLRLVPSRHFVEVDTVENMAEALIRATGDPQPIRDMARAGRQAVAERYDWSILADKLEQVWLEQLKSD